MSPAETSGKLSFAQGLQLFFIQRILEEHTMTTFFGDDKLNELLMQWSQIVRAGLKDDPSFPSSIKVPKGFGKRETQPGPPKEITLSVQGRQVRRTINRSDSDLSFVPQQYRETYRPILENSDFSPFFSLLDDEDLGRLMRVEFTAELAELAKATAPAARAESKDADIVREAVARQVGKKPDELTDDDYRRIKGLNLSGSAISDLEYLKDLTNLEELSLAGTQVTDVGPLSFLKNLQKLDLAGTQVVDVGPLASLADLQWLSLAGTRVTDVGPLASLTQLNTLNLSGTQVNDIDPLSGLTNLQVLYLNDTPVANVDPLASLTQLQTLILSSTEVSDIGALSGLINLKILYLYGTKISNLGILACLSSLQSLSLCRAQVSDIGMLSGLTNLKWVDITSTKVSKEQVAELQKSLPDLKIYR